MKRSDLEPALTTSLERTRLLDLTSELSESEMKQTTGGVVIPEILPYILFWEPIKRLIRPFLLPFLRRLPLCF